MLRKFVTLDGEVLEESEYVLKPIDTCFYCGRALMMAFHYCAESQTNQHEWITLCDTTSIRR